MHSGCPVINHTTLDQTPHTWVDYEFVVKQLQSTNQTLSMQHNEMAFKDFVISS